MVIIFNNQWTKISDSRYVNPELGNIYCFKDKWEATPRIHIHEKSREFNNLQEAKDWMETLGRVVRL